MFDHPIILIIVAAAALLRWLSQKSDAGTSDPERPIVPDQPIPRSSETQTEEERIRRFLEALGQPTTYTPPPRVKRTKAPKREVFPRVRPLGSPLPPLTTAPPPLVEAPPPLSSFPTSTTQAPPPPPSEERVFKPATPKEVGFEVQDLGAQVLSGSAAEQRGFALNLASIQNLRSAIVLREIFGPPRSLQSLDPISGF